jgi:hypothetical protein
MDDKVGDILKDISKTLETELGIPVHVINTKTIEDLLEIFSQDKAISTLFSEQELRHEIQTFYQKLMIFPPKDDVDYRQRVENFYKNLSKEKLYTAKFCISEVYDIPVGIKIGDFTIIEPDFYDENIKMHLDYMKEQYPKLNFNSSWGEIQFKSVRTQLISDILYEKLEFPFSVLALMLQKYLDPKDTVGVIFSDHGTVTFIGPFEGGGYSIYDHYFDRFLTRLSEISMKKKPSKLETKIIRSLEIFWLSQSTQKREIQFILLISTLESLLLTKNDRDYLGLKVAEKTAFLLETTQENRIILYKALKKFYRLRSELIHSGSRKIQESEFIQLKNLVYRTLLKMLDLSIYYTQMEEQSEESKEIKIDGIEDILLKLKFDGPKT